MEHIPIDPKKEAQKIVSDYLTSIRLGKTKVQMSVDRPSHWLERDKAYDRDRAEDGLLVADEKFGQLVDDLHNERTVFSKVVLEEIVRLLTNRNDLTFLCKSIIKRIKDDLYMGKGNI